MAAIAHSLQRAHRRRRRSRALAVTAVAGVLLGTALYWLSGSGTTGTNIHPPSGLTNGKVADVQAMSSTVTASNGGAQSETGKTIAKLFVAKDFTNKIKVNVAWTNAVDANKVLNNPNAQIVVGLYHPVATIAVDGSCADSQVKVVDNGSYFCTEEDTAAGGSQAVSGGDLFLAPSLLSGYVIPSAPGGDAGSTPCASDSAVWCQPSGDDATHVGIGADQRLIYVVASITVPGGTPPGQQQQLPSLTFYLSAARTS